MNTYLISDKETDTPQWKGLAESPEAAIATMNYDLYLFDEDENPEMLNPDAWNVFVTAQ